MIKLLSVYNSRSVCVLKCGQDHVPCRQWKQARSDCLGGAEFYSSCAVQQRSLKECRECLEEANDWMNGACRRCFDACNKFLPNGMETVVPE